MKKSVKTIMQCGVNLWICSTQHIPRHMAPRVRLVCRKLQLGLVHQSFTSEIKPETPNIAPFYEYIKQKLSKDKRSIFLRGRCLISGGLVLPTFQ